MKQPSRATALHPDEATTASDASNPIDQWLDRVTRRLVVDRELQLEVQLELRSHVDDSIAELRGAGRNEAGACEEALRALGNEDDLSEQLWRANRRRMKLRALAVWAARLALPPLAAALVVALSFGGLTSWAVLGHWTGSENFPGEAMLAERAKDIATRNATPDVRLLVDQSYAPWAKQPELSRELVNLYPDDLALRADYVGGVLHDIGVSLEELPASAVPPVGRAAIATMPTNADDNTVGGLEPPREPEQIIKVDERKLAETLSVLADAERREPGNALYPLLQASVLYYASTITRQDWAHQIIWPGTTEPTPIPLVVVKDPTRHALAVAAIERAADRPYFKTHAAELARRQWDAMPSNSLQDLTLRVRVQPNWRGGNYAWQTLCTWARNGAAHPAEEALRAARDGKSDAEVDRLLQQTRTIAQKMAADAEDVEELQGAYGAYQTVEETQAYIGAVRGDGERLHEHLLRDVVLSHKVDRAARSARFDYDVAGILAAADWNVAGTLDRTPVRQAEYAAADQVGVGALAACLLILAALYALVAFVRWLLIRRAAWAPRLFVGWRRCAVVVGGGAVLPVVLYFAYARFTPLGGRRFGLNTTWIHVEIEYAILGALVLILTSILTGRAVVSRLRELRVTPPKSLVLKNLVTGWPKAAAIALGLAGPCLALALFTSLVDQHASLHFWLTLGNEQWQAQLFEIAVAAALIAFATGVRFGTNARSIGKPAARDASTSRPAVAYGWYARAAFAPLMMAAIAVALIGLPLRFVEARAVRAAVASGQPAVYFGEVERSVLKSLREQLVRGEVEITPEELREAAQRPVDPVMGP